jgi:iron complex outermembrane recepter protein
MLQSTKSTHCRGLFLSAVCATYVANCPWASAADNTSATGSTPADSGALEEIVVTAEKRSTDLQRTPISMTAISDRTLDDEQIRSLTDIAGLAPTFKMGETDGYQQITIRGIGISNFTPGFDSAVAVNVNGVYLSRPVAQATSLFDVSQIEVLRGPQGTLYGRNASAGSVNISTVLPTNNLSGYARVVVGNYHDVDVEGAIGGALIPDVLQIRVAGFQESRGGYGKNIVTGNPVDDKFAQGIRATVIYYPISNLKATIIAERYLEKENGADLHYFGAAGLSGRPGALGQPPTFELFGGYTTSNPWNIANGVDPKFYLDATTVTGNLDWDLSPFTVRSISGYRTQNAGSFAALDGGSVYNVGYLSGEPAWQFSEELQAHYDSSKLHATLGLYYFKERDDYTPSVLIVSGQLLNEIIPLPQARPATTYFDFVELGGLFRTQAEAAFGQATYNLTNQFSLTAGIRYSHEHKGLNQIYGVMVDEPLIGNTPPPPVQQPTETFTSTTPRFGLQYQISPQAMAYLTYSKGFKAGGYDPGYYPAARFEPETLDDYEIGLKSSWLDKRLTTDVNAFFYDYKNLQVNQIVGVSTTTANAATAHIYGIEAEFRAQPTLALRIDGNVSWLHARYVSYFGADPAVPLLATNVDFSGKALDNAPDFSAHLSAQYTWQVPGGQLVARAEGDYSSRYYFAPDNEALLSQDAFVKGNAYLTYNSDSRWYTTAFIRNLSNIATKDSAIVNTILVGNTVQGTYAPPRMYGLEVGYRF